VEMSGLVVSSVGYNFPLDDNFSEDITLVGNYKVWKSGTATNTVSTDCGVSYYPNGAAGSFGGNNDAPIGDGGVNRRENIQFATTTAAAQSGDYTILPEDIPGVDTSGVCENRLMRAYILAGGYSKRFGEDKTLYRVFQKPLILEVFEKVSPFFETFVVTKDLKKYKKFSLPLLEDLFKEIQTPLVGIYTGLRHSTEQFNLFLSADLPLLDTRYLEFVKRYPFEEKYLGYIPVLEGKKHYTCGVYSKKLTPLLEKAIKEGNLSLKQFEKYFRFWREEELLKENIKRFSCFNLNTKRDLERLKDILGG
jgi:molybdopterin-guanine dinucleotide biosynthesis protein A